MYKATENKRSVPDEIPTSGEKVVLQCFISLSLNLDWGSSTTKTNIHSIIDQSNYDLLFENRACNENTSRGMEK